MSDLPGIGDYLLEQELRRAERHRHEQNAARHALSFHAYHSTGGGELEFSDPVEFGMTFAQRPFITYGYFIDSDDLVEGQFPACTGFVTAWDFDADGLYIGAWCGVVIRGGEFLEPPYEIEHHFTFQGIALKDLPLDRGDDDG